jgi:hypothetical protein
MTAVSESGEILHERYLRKMYSAYGYFPTTKDLFGKSGLAAEIQGHAAASGDIFSPMVLGNLVHTSTVLLTRERALKAGLFNEAFRTGEDYPFHLETCRQGPVAFVDAVTIRYAIGLADALTAPDKLIQIATHFVQTLESTLEREQDRIQLPRATVQSRLAEAYAWVGHENLKAGNPARARSYFSKSLRANPASLSGLKDYASTLVSARMRTRLRSLKNMLRA